MRSSLARWLPLAGVIGMLTGCASVQPDPVVAQIGAETITLSEYNKALSSAVTAEGGERFKTEEGRKQLLENMIRGKLIVAIARKEGIAARPGVQKSIAILKQEVDDYFNVQAGEIIGREYVNEKLASADKAADDYYEKYKADFDGAIQVKARHILFPSEAVANIARERLLKGENFQGLARQLSRDPATASKGGELEAFGRAQCPWGRNFEEAAFALHAPGELSPVVKTPRGYHLIQLVERKAASPPTHEETMFRIRAMIKMERYDGLVEAAAREIQMTRHDEVLSQAKARPPGPGEQAEAGTAPRTLQ